MVAEITQLKHGYEISYIADERVLLLENTWTTPPKPKSQA